MKVKIFLSLFALSLLFVACNEQEHAALDPDSFQRRIIDQGKERKTADEVARRDRSEPCPPCPCDTIPEPPADGILEANRNVMITRPANFTGFVPTVRHVSSTARKRSYLSTPTPELDYFPADPENADDTYIIRRDDISSWDDVPFNKESLFLFLITPGDYVDLGELNITRSGTADRRVVVRYYDENKSFDGLTGYDLHMQNRAAILEGLSMGTHSDREKKGIHDFTAYQLTFIGQSREKGGIKYGRGYLSMPGSYNITIEYCYAFKSAGARLYGNNIWFQNNVDLGRVEVRGDIGGVAIYTTETLESYNCGIVGNEIDHTDGIGLPRDGTNEDSYKTVNGTIIADNDIYNAESLSWMDPETGLYHSCGGEGIDVKNGSSDPLNPVRIFDNRIWAIYPTPIDKSCGDNTGSLGGGINSHKYQQNVLIYDNMIWRTTNGVDITGTAASRPGRHTAEIAVFNNLITDMLIQTMTINGRTTITGTGIRMNSDTSDAIYNTIINAHEAFELEKAKKTPQYVWGNRMIGCRTGEPESVALLSTGENFFAESSDIEMTDLTITVQRWTNPHTIVLRNAVVTEGQQEKIAELYAESDVTKIVSQLWWAEYFDELVLQ